MKKNTLVFSLILFGLFSCKNEKTEKIIRPSKTQKIVEKNSHPTFSPKEYKMVYNYSNGDSNQVIGINVTDKNSLKFHLVTNTLPCDTEYWGIAENKHGNGDGEIDENEEGGYFVKEYFKEEKEYSIGIRLAKDLSKVQIKYIQKDSLETDCFPITEQIMKRIK